MVRLDRIYTGGGDGGETSLGDGGRVAKDCARVAAMGDVDELNSVLGLAILEAGAGTELAQQLGSVQNDLFDVGADLAVPESPDGANARTRLRVTALYVSALERWIDAVNADLPPLTSFVLPGGTPLACRLHVARAVCRRAERAAVTLSRTEPVTPELLTYLNRLSDLLFVLSRAANAGSEPLWQPGLRR
jgi:cob(I)alamin adenosyltransferase